MTLSSLIERLEKAEGPSRELIQQLYIRVCNDSGSTIDSIYAYPVCTHRYLC